MGPRKKMKHKTIKTTDAKTPRIEPVLPVNTERIDSLSSPLIKLDPANIFKFFCVLRWIIL